jgi:GNAT superfamily N-acetyltransferase
MGNIDIVTVDDRYRRQAADILGQFLKATNQYRSSEDIRAEVDARIGGLSRMWIARCAETICACVTIQPLQFPDAFELKRMFVRPANRRSGLATALLRHAESFAWRGGASWLYLDANRTMTEALALYERNGFQYTVPYRAGTCGLCLRKDLSAFTLEQSRGLLSAEPLPHNVFAGWLRL